MQYAYTIKFHDFALTDFLDCITLNGLQAYRNFRLDGVLELPLYSHSYKITTDRLMGIAFTYGILLDAIHVEVLIFYIYFV